MVGIGFVFSVSKKAVVGLGFVGVYKRRIGIRMHPLVCARAFFRRFLWFLV